MDCAKLRTDIEKLRAAQEVFRQQLDESNDAEKLSQRRQLKNAQDKATKLGDELLQEYLQEFAEKNPEFLQYCIATEIVGENSEPFQEDVRGIIPTSDNRFIIGGARGSIRVCERDDSGKWALGAELNPSKNDIDSSSIVVGMGAAPDGEIFVSTNRDTVICQKVANGNWALTSAISDKSNESPRNATSISSTPDGGMFIGNNFGTIFICDKASSGVWRVNKETKVVSSSLYGEQVWAMAPTPDGRMFICTSKGVRIYEQDDKGEWRPGPFVHDENNLSISDTITAITTLSDGSIMMGGLDGHLYICEQDDGGNWRARLEAGADQGADSITSIIPLSGDEVIVGGGGPGYTNGTTTAEMFVFKKGHDGIWQTDQQNLCESAPQPVRTADIATIAAASDGTIVLGTRSPFMDESGFGNDSGRIYILEKTPTTVDTLKQQLDNIIAKGEK